MASSKVRADEPSLTRETRQRRWTSMALLICPSALMALRFVGLLSFALLCLAAFAEGTPTLLVGRQIRELQQRVASLEAQLAACQSMNAVATGMNGVAPLESSPPSASSAAATSLSRTGRHEGTRAASAQSLHQACTHGRLSV